MSELLEKVYASPDDDTAKLVVADALLEQKDPRGEFITLQFKAWRGEATKEDRARSSALLSKYRAAWLGPLADALEPDSVTFEKGFLKQGTLKASALAPEVRLRWLAAPALQELRELVLPELGAAELTALLEQPPLRHLLGVRLASTHPLQALAHHPWPFASLGLAGAAKALSTAVVTVATGAAFASVKRLVLQLERFGRSSVTELLRGFSGVTSTRFTELQLETTKNDSSTLGYALVALHRLAPASIAVVTHPHLSARLAEKQLVVRAGATASHVFELLHSFDVRGVGLVVHQAGGALPSDVELDALRDDLRRLQPASAVFPAEWGLVDL